MKQPTTFLQEDNGNMSSMRLMCEMSLISAIGFSYLTLIGSSNNPDAILIIYGFLIGAFAPKAIQKFAEQKV